MTNNSIIFGIPGATQNVFSGSLLSFKVAGQAEIKEATDQNNNFIGVAKSKIKKVATFSVLLETSGSTVTLPPHLTPATIVNAMSGDVSGNWYVTGTPSIDWKNDDFAKADGEVTQWISGSGQSL